MVLVGDDPASAVYVGAKERTCIELGMRGETIRRPASITQDELLAIVDRLNADPAVHGILVQMPLPKHIDAEAVVRRIRPDKDVDGFHPMNVGKLLIGEQGRVRAVHAGRRAATCFRRAASDAGANCVIVGRSNIVGKPMASLMIQPGVDATVTVCHSRTRDLGDETRRADILIVAAGRPRDRHGRHGEAGRGRDRRRHESHSRRDEEERHAAGRRRGVRRGARGRVAHHAGAGRSGQDDDRHAHGEHRSRRRAALAVTGRRASRRATSADLDLFEDPAPPTANRSPATRRS